MIFSVDKFIFKIIDIAAELKMRQMILIYKLSLLL